MNTVGQISGPLIHWAVNTVCDIPITTHHQMFMGSSLWSMIHLHAYIKNRSNTFGDVSVSLYCLAINKEILLFVDYTHFLMPQDSDAPTAHLTTPRSETNSDRLMCTCYSRNVGAGLENYVGFKLAKTLASGSGKG